MPFMEPKGSVLYSQEPFTGTYPESDEFGCYIVFYSMYTCIHTSIHTCIHPQEHYPAIMSGFPSGILPWSDKPSFNTVTKGKKYFCRFIKI
jgi:hypothetical protein